MTEMPNNNSDLVAQRKAKLAIWRMTGDAYRNDFRRDHLACDVQKSFDTLVSTDKIIHLAGRMMLKRIMGKAAFVHIQDMSGRIQIYIRQNDISDSHYQDFKTWDIGDIIGVTGKAFKTHTGEISVKASHIVLLTKSLQPLPDKFHGLHDQELCYRKRYVDLIINEKTRQTFMMRSKIIEFIRDFLKKHNFLEVETPMMQVMAGGATAKPFVTHHHALDMDLYLRIAPELYLKRLVIGGFEKVFEINRNFRNEGLSTRHNPEFTMVEFYQAYADYRDLMDLTETLMRALVLAVLNTSVITYQKEIYDFSLPFERLSLIQAILKYNPDISASELNNLESISLIAKKLGIPVLPETGLGKIQLEIFEKTVEHQLKNPVFITEYPAEVSPLARRNNDNPFVTDRFEFFVGGREIANAFSELNDPEDQAKRFADQVKQQQLGDQEAMNNDQDYIHALEHGLPPTAGEGIGIDRLVMLLTDSASIKDVILFPHMRLKEDNA